MRCATPVQYSGATLPDGTVRHKNAERASGAWECVGSAVPGFSPHVGGINAGTQRRRGWSLVPGPLHRLFTAVHSVPQSFLLITAVHAETVTGSTFAAASAL